MGIRASAAPILGAAALLAAASAGARAAVGPSTDVADDFRQNCFSCHTIGGGRLTGPDLKDIAKRRDADWLVRWILSPKKVIDAGDAEAIRLRDEYRGVVMPDISAMTAARAEKLLRLIAEESAKDKSPFKGLSLIDRPLLPSDAVAGRALFTGNVRLKNGAPPCLSCHSIGGLGNTFGGGGLGPDLTEAVSRLGGDKALAAWLVAPASPVMRPIFQKRPIDAGEILPLTAYLKSVVAKERPAGAEARLPFLIVGIMGAAGLLFALDAAWGGRLRSVRRALVAQNGSVEGPSASEGHDE